MKYSTKTQETALLAKKEDIKNFFEFFGRKNPNIFFIVKKNEEAEGKYTDALMTIGTKRYAFRFVSSKHEIEISNNKNWKILRGKTTSFNDKPMSNPMKWFEGTVEADYYLYPVRNPKGSITYDRSKVCVGNYAHVIEFIEKKSTKDYN